jgi:predicted DNA-binding transcriptional regulator YafY
MGQRTASETLTAIIVAFWRRPVWSQADLARESGVAARTVRRHLEELSLAGWPLQREDDHPHVYWSVPKGWFPGGVPLDPEAIAALLTVLVRVPPSAARTLLLNATTGHAPQLVVDALDRVIPPRTSEMEETLLPVLLDGLVELIPLRLQYWTASRGSRAARTVSVQRVLLGPPTRFVAWCHTAQALRWFRLDYAASARRDESATFHGVDDAEVDTLLSESVDGFHGHERVLVAFFVRDPEARWVAQNLPDGLIGTSEGNGLYVEAETAGLLPAARFVVGLGAAAECRSPELATLVRELAQGALHGEEQV